MIPSRLTGKIIKEWRTRKSLTQSEMATLLGISTISLRNYEKESRPDKPAPVEIPLLFDWALAAVDAGISVYSAKANQR